MTRESIKALAGDLDRVLAQRPVDLVAAAAVLERAIAACRSDPAAADQFHEPELWDELVDVYERLGRTDDAISAMRSAIAVGWRGRPDGRCRIAELLMRAGRVAETAPLWEQVRADTPDDVWLYNNAGLEYAAVGDDVTALTWLTDGLHLALATGDPERLVDQLRDLRGAALARLGRPADDLQDRATQFLAGPAPTAHRLAGRPPTNLPGGRPSTAAALSPFRRPDTTVNPVPRPEVEPGDGPVTGRRMLMLALAWFPADQYQQARAGQVAAVKHFVQEFLGCGDGGREVIADESGVGKGPEPHGDRDGIVDGAGLVEGPVDRRVGFGRAVANLHPSQGGSGPAFGDA